LNYQDKEYSDHQFFKGYCVKCGWSKQWAEKNGWKCPASETWEKNTKEESFESEEINFSNHRFVDGYCERCGWSYDWAKKKNEECPVLEKNKNYQKSSYRNESYQKERKEYKTSNEFANNSDAIKYGKILGLKGKVTIKDIKKNYRNLSKKYHPDRVNNLGSEFSEIADKKMKNINEAYVWFKKKYDF